MEHKALDVIGWRQASAPEPRARRWLGRRRGKSRQRPVVRQYGVLGAFLAPIGLTIALLLAGYGAVSLATTYSRSYQRHVEHTALTHVDRSAIEIRARSELPADAVDLVVRDVDGELRHVVASRSEADAHVNQVIAMLDAERDRIKQAAAADIDQAFDYAFADRDQVVEAYADWFFAWKRSYVLLKETLVSTAARAIETGTYEHLGEAVERDVNEYFMRHYMVQVLKPELRDRRIVSVLDHAVRGAHDSFRRAVANSDLRMQLFLARHTTHMADVPRDEPMVTVSLDWDAQRWKAPVYLMEDRAFDGIAGIGQAAAGGTIGALALGPAIGRGMNGAFAMLSRRFVAKMGSRLAFARNGAAAGSFVAPAGGPAVGALAGVLVGFGADYVLNRTQASFDREDFVTAAHAGLDVTIEEWKSRLQANIDAAVDRWFDDARASIVLASR